MYFHRCERLADSHQTLGAHSRPGGSKAGRYERPIGITSGLGNNVHHSIGSLTLSSIEIVADTLEVTPARLILALLDATQEHVDVDPESIREALDQG